jgi:hypothetical protein
VSLPFFSGFIARQVLFHPPAEFAVYSLYLGSLKKESPLLVRGVVFVFVGVLLARILHKLVNVDLV